jgi:hypothetical protein
MKLSPDHDVLLFYEDFEQDRFLPNDRLLRRAARKLVHRFRRGGQKVTGFYVWFQSLKRALELSGRRVHVNRRDLAFANPDFVVALCGYPHVLKHWRLPNPSILGPGLFDHPKQAPTDLMKNPSHRAYVVTCEWMYQLFHRYYGDKCVKWHGGIDTDKWVDTRGASKDIDVLVYDKVRFDRERQESALMAPVYGELKLRGLRVETISYKHYTQPQYQALLRRSRAMVFLCEHETQGMAYQEALASNVPILAWDAGVWADPRRPQWEAEPVPASSVPYFSSECGERFKTVDEFSAALDLFRQRLETYRPREFVLRELSFESSANAWLRIAKTG